MNTQPKVITKTIDKFYGSLTRENIKDMNSGKAKFETTFGNNPFINPSNLTWFEQPSSILSTTNIDGPIAPLKPHMERGTEYVYGMSLGYTTDPKLYKIQVNDPLNTNNPNFDKPSVIGAITSQTAFIGPDIQIGSVVGTAAGIDTYRLFVGHDGGVSKINSDGSSYALIVSGSYVINMPRPLANFVGKTYFGNGNNIGEIDSTETVTTGSKLSPSLPPGLIVRDLDITPDGNYLQITASRINQVAQTGTLVDTNSLGSTDSYKFYWNGSDAAATSSENFSGYSLTANTVFSSKSYTLGLDMGGSALYDGPMKQMSLPAVNSPNFSSVFPINNLIGFATTVYDTSAGHLKGDIYFYGQYDQEVPLGLYRLCRWSSGQGTDVQFVPSCTPVSNLWYAPPSYNYTNNIAGAAKLYFSATEQKNAGGLQLYFPLYKFSTVPTGSGAAIAGVYETQNEIFSKKVKPTEIRFYTEPLVSGNSFQLDLIGSNGNPITNGTKTFTVGASDIVAGQDYVWWNPAIAPTHNLGVRISNLGTVNWIGVKMEIDLVEQGK